MNSIARTREIVDRYSYAWFRGDIDEAAGYLADDLNFLGSIDQFDQAAPFVEALRRFRALVTDVDILSRFYSTDEAALLYDCRTDTNAGRIRTAEFFHIADRKIDRIRLVFDASRLRLLMEQGA